MKKNKKYLISFLILIILVLITFFVLFKDYKIKDITNAVELINKKYIFYAVLMFFIYLFFEALSTKMLLKRIGVNKSFLNNFKYAAVDYYFSSITPSALGGQPMSLVYMQKDNVPIHKSSLILLVNSVIFRSTLVIYGVFMLAFKFKYLKTNFLIIVFLVGLVINLVFIAIFLLALIKESLVLKVGNAIIHWLKKIKILKKEEEIYKNRFRDSITNFVTSYKYLKKDKFTLSKVLIANIIQRGSLFFISYLIYRSFGYNTESVLSLMAIQVFIAIAVDSLPIPGGVGLSEELMFQFFGFIYMEKMIFPAMLITRALSFYIPMLLSGIIIIFSQIVVYLKKKKKSKGENYDRNI